jgi:hypothetical protein
MNQDRGESGNGTARRGANRAEVRIQSPGVHLQATVQLRREKNDPEEQNQKIEAL